MIYKHWLVQLTQLIEHYEELKFWSVPGNKKKIINLTELRCINFKSEIPRRLIFLEYTELSCIQILLKYLLARDTSILTL